jgi:dihydroxy-acid dehydratase
VEDNDIIEIDVLGHKINLLADEQTLTKRRAAWKAPKLNAKNGILLKYAKQVKTAADGCVTDED